MADRAASNGTASTSARAAASAPRNGATVDAEGGDLLSERVTARALEDLPPLFTRLDERPAESLQYLGVSFGLTAPLLKFWQRQGFAAVYLRQTASDVTGEHTCIVLKALASPEVEKQVRAAALQQVSCSDARGRDSPSRCRSEPGSAQHTTSTCIAHNSVEHAIEIGMLYDAQHAAGSNARR